VVLPAKRILQAKREAPKDNSGIDAGDCAQERIFRDVEHGKTMIIIADNLHALNPIVAEAMQKLDPKPVRELALRCVEAGAGFLDINPGYLSRRHEDRMAFLVEAVQDVSTIPLVLDSPNPGVLARGLSASRGRVVLNGLSMEERKLQEILPLAVEHHTLLVLLLMDETSFTPPSMEEKLSLALALREQAIAAGLEQEGLIFDPILPNLSWQDAFLRVGEVARTIQMLSSGALLQEPAHTVVGLSNLRSGLRKRYPSSVESTCLGLLAGAGLEYVLANVLDPELTTTCRLINQMTSR
jgi:cobalamin-dependent methionine synthase I